MRIKLNRTAILRIEIPKFGYSLVWDTEQPNFGIRITSTGARSYIVQRRVLGKNRRITIGNTTTFTPEQARTQARKLLGHIAEGRDPLAERAISRSQAVTLKEAFAAYLTARHNLKPLTVADMKKAMRSLEKWNDKPITAISPEMVESKHSKLGESSKARANLTMRYLRAILNFAAEKYTDAAGVSVLPVNPVRRLSKMKAWYRVKRRTTFIKSHELKPWMQAVSALKGTGVRDYLQLTLLTGLRRSEGLGLLWADVDFKDRTLTVPDTKNHKSHTLPLSDCLYKLLKTRKESAVGDFVFESEQGRLSNLRYGMDTVKTKSGVNFCINDLRRTFITVAESLDTPAYVLKALLNHKTGGDVTAGYIQITTERLREPMQKIADFFLEAGGVLELLELVTPEVSTIRAES